MNDTDRTKLRDLVFFCFERNLPIVPTGSRGIASSEDIREDSDYDYVVKTTPDVTRYLRDQGYERNGEIYGQDRVFQAWRSGQLNIIQASIPKWLEATQLANKLRCRTKEQRVAVFDSVFNGNGLWDDRAVFRTASLRGLMQTEGDSA